MFEELIGQADRIFGRFKQSDSAVGLGRAIYEASLELSNGENVVPITSKRD